MHLSSKDGMAIFNPLVAIADTDTKWGGALKDVWPCIWLLLCCFHLWQCWTNQHKRSLTAKDADFGSTMFSRECKILKFSMSSKDIVTVHYVD